EPQLSAHVFDRRCFLLIFTTRRSSDLSGKQRRHQRSKRHSFEPGAVAIDPLARRRDRLTAIGRRRSDIAKKKSAKKKSYSAGGAGAPTDKNKFPNQKARESAGASNPSACG